MTLDEMIKQNSADDGLDREAIEEVATFENWKGGKE